MGQDVNGFYAMLGVDPFASQEAIGAAFRRKAKELHPDVAGTGNAHAFMSLRRAYETLSEPIARRMYDHTLQQIDTQPIQHSCASNKSLNNNKNAKAWLSICIATPLIASVAWFGHSWTDTNVGTAKLSGVQSSLFPKQNGSYFIQPRILQTDADKIPSTGANFPKSRMYYALAADVPFPIWHKAPQGGYVQDGSVEPFTNVELLRPFSAGNLAEVRFADGSSGYMNPHDIGPGDATAAKEAYCLYRPGRPLDGQRILSRVGSGPHKITIENQGSQPAVVVMRSASGRSAVTLLIAAYNTAYVDQFPSGVYRPEFLFGDSWSEKCDGLFGHRHAQRFPNFDAFEVKWLDGPNSGYDYTVMHYTITPVLNGNTKVVEMLDDEFKLD